MEDEDEDEANDFAANHLVPRQAFIALMREKPISKDRIVEFAEQHNVSPGIVLGQLQKRKRLPFQTNLNQLKRFKFDLTSV
jgi:HTH-type transcriptional regulator/antitoxin HigA